ncbi:phosphoglycolate phosphatase, partial [Xanthomonas oryzae pv. oryzae]
MPGDTQLTTDVAAADFPRVVLFDLDGTLLDSAPDMLATVNAMLDARGRAPIALASLRPVVSKGARAMLGVAFAELDAEACVALVPEFLQRYEDVIGTQSQLFDGVEELMVRLENAGCVWG